MTRFLPLTRWIIILCTDSACSKRELILKELTLRLIRAGMHREALDELDLLVILRPAVQAGLMVPNRNLPTFPFQDNPVLHVYAGLLAVYLAQPKPNPEVSIEGTPL